MVDAVTLHRKRKAEVEYTEYTHDGLPKNIGYLPEWTKTLIRRHKYIGDKPVRLF